MQNWIRSILMGLALVLTATSSSLAESTLVAIYIEPEWPATSTPGNVVTYKVTAVAREGQGLLEVTLTCAGLPPGATYSFSPAMLRFTGRVPLSQVAYLTVTCPTAMPIGSYPFSVTGAAQRETRVYTNQVVAPYSGPPMLMLVGQSDGSFLIRGLGECGQTYQIESTTDLANSPWVSLGPTTADGNGRFVFSPAQANNSPARFYRAVGMPSN